MEDILTGKAVLNGIQNDGTAITMTGYATFVLAQMNASHAFNITDLIDELGFDTASSATNMHTEISMDFTPYSTTRALAAALTVFPTPLTDVTIANCRVAAFNGLWIYRGGAQIQQSAGVIVKITGMTLRQYTDATQNASMAQTVSG